MYCAKRCNFWSTWNALIKRLIQNKRPLFTVCDICAFWVFFSSSCPEFMDVIVSDAVGGRLHQMEQLLAGSCRDRRCRIVLWVTSSDPEVLRCWNSFPRVISAWLRFPKEAPGCSEMTTSFPSDWWCNSGGEFINKSGTRAAAHAMERGLLSILYAHPQLQSHGGCHWALTRKITMQVQ